jgi:alanine racemase
MRALPVELKLDTGMGRLGIQEGELGQLRGILSSCRDLRVVGFLTHLASSDERSVDSILDQEHRLRRMLSQLPDALVQAASIHSCNSGALLQLGLGHPGIGDRTGVVRPGVMLYGAAPSRLLQDSPVGRLLTSIGRWQTRVIEVRSLAPGDAVGYGSTWRVEGESPERIAVLPVGYADGFRRSLGGRAEVLIRGGRFPVVGRVSMDLISIHVNERVRVGDEVVLLGSQEGELGCNTIPVWEWADLCGTIPYEIWTGLGSRVRRVLAPV